MASPSLSLSYRLILSQRILSICSRSTYENVTNFEWYLSVLVDLAHIANADVGAEIRDQLVDVVGRVRAAMRYAVQLMYSVLTDDSMINTAGEEGSCSEILWAAGWIVGEYCESVHVPCLTVSFHLHRSDRQLSEPERILPYLLRPEVISLSPETVSVYIQAAIKVFGFWASELAQRWDEDDLPKIRGVVESISERMNALTSSPYIEVQERVRSSHIFLDHSVLTR